MNPSWRKNYLRYKSYFLNISQSYNQRVDIKVYLEILLSLVTIIMFSVFALRPTLLTISQLIKEIENKKELIVQINDKLQDISAAQNIYYQHTNQIDVLNKAVPPDPSVDVFARQFEGLITKHPVTLVSLNTGKATILGSESTGPQKKYEPLPENANELSFTLGISTNLQDYPKIHDFLTDLEHLRIPLKVDSLSLTTSRDRDNQGNNILLNIGGRAPYLKEP